MKKFITASALSLAAGMAGSAFGHSTDATTDHITATFNYGFNVIGRDLLAGEITGRYTDVWSHNGFAYVGTFQQPTCDRSGVFVVDMQKAVDNYANGITEGAVVAEIKSAPNTRVNDVKVHTITFKNQTRDVLIATEEKCGGLNGNNKQLGQGGISFYDVTNPARPHAIKQHAIGENGVHNTYAWTSEDGNTYALGVDDLDLNDVIIIDITKPQAPKEIGRIGIGDWLSGGYPEIADDGQLFTGVFASPLLHDVWVTRIGDADIAVLSYWDAGFVIADVTDPFNPEIIGDSTYPDPDPIFGAAQRGDMAEGNGHAAVFGGTNGEYIFGGDEDFDPLRTQVVGASGTPFLATQGSDTFQLITDESRVGDATYVGLACDPIPSTVTGGIAMIQRGDCAFTTKVLNAESAGYEAAVVFNHSFGCGAGVSMLVEGGIPAFFVPRPSGMDLLGLGGAYDPSSCTGDGSDNGDPLLEGYEGTNVGVVSVSVDFDGWGYFHVLNNKLDEDLNGLGTTSAVAPIGEFAGLSPAERQNLADIPYLGHMGYFAPAELTDPSLALNAGDLTMHNVEADPTTQDQQPSFDAGPRAFISWYSAGMRAVEYRPGHWHTDTAGGGVVSWNVHEVGQFIAEDGSNFWGVHVDTLGDQQVILGSDRNTGLWIFTFECEDRVLDENGQDTGLYCRRNP